MKAFHFQAEWLPDTERMHVTFVVDGHRYTELFTRKQWDEYVASFDTSPLRLGGWTIELRGDGAVQIDKDIKSYLRQVDEALRLTGKTDKLRSRK